MSIVLCVQVTWAEAPPLTSKVLHGMVIDLGLTKRLKRVERECDNGSWAGTLAYMPPQVRLFLHSAVFIFLQFSPIAWPSHLLDIIEVVRCTGNCVRVSHA